MSLSEHVSDAVRGLAKYSSSFAAAASTMNLTNQTGNPNHAAQIVDAFNASTTTTENLVWKDVNAVAHTTPIGPLGRYTPPIPVSEITGTTGDDISADIYWFPALGSTTN